MDPVKDEFLSEEDLDLVNLSDAELDAYWDLWLHQAQASNDLDAHLYSHGVFVEEPRIEPFPPRPAERQALDFILAGEGEVLAALRVQLENVRVRRRSITTAGFYLELEPAAPERVLSGKRSFEIGDVQAEIRGLAHGMGLILFVRDGLAELLEGHMWAEDLPWDWQLASLSYIDAFRVTDPRIERPPDAARSPGTRLTSEVREKPPHYPRE